MVIKEAMLTSEQRSLIFPELEFRTSRSGGKGGQHVNKTESKVELIWDFAASTAISEEQRNRIALAFEGGSIHIISQSSRSQGANKEEAIRKFYALLERIFKPVKKRRATKPSKASKLRRKESKKKQSEKKLLRKKNF